MSEAKDVVGAARGSSEHTPGPWMVDQDGEVFPIGPDGEPVIESEIAMVVSDRPKDRTLIAAAPDLYDALRPLASVARWLRVTMEDSKPLWGFGASADLTVGDIRRAAAALAKAGESE